MTTTHFSSHVLIRIGKRAEPDLGLENGDCRKADVYSAWFSTLRNEEKRRSGFGGSFAGPSQAKTRDSEPRSSQSIIGDRHE